MQITSLVARGLGWAFAVKTDDLPNDRISVLRMPNLTLMRTTYLAMRKDRQFGAAAERFRDYVLTETATV